MVQILTGDCREVLKTLPDGSVNCCVTSPPYWGLRDYGHGGQIGLEQTPEAYVAELVAVFGEVRRVLRDDGTLWLNLGDSYCSTDKWGGGKSGNSGKHTVADDGDVPSWACRAKRDPIPGIKPKDLVGIPWRVAFALQADGWYLRQDIIWAKPNPMPESVTDRCTKSHEYIFLLSKRARYYYDAESIAEPVAESSVERLSQPTLATQTGSARVPGKTNGNMKAVGRGGKNAFRGQGSNRCTETGPASRDGRDMKDVGASATRNKRDVWTVATKPYKNAHFATFPPTLILPCILAGCPAGGTVLDPFGGSGTTGEVAIGNGRNAIIIELNPTYCTLATNRGGLFCQQGIA
jgi:DNA modification methylase